MPLAIKRNPPTCHDVGRRCVGFDVCTPDGFRVYPFAIPDPPTIQSIHGDRITGFGAARVAIVATIPVVHIDPAVVFIVWMYGDVHHPAHTQFHLEEWNSDAVVVRGWCTLNQLRLFTVWRDDAQPERLFGDQDSPIR